MKAHQPGIPITVRWPPDELEALKAQARKEDRGMSDLIRQAVKWYLLRYHEFERSMSQNDTPGPVGPVTSFKTEPPQE